MMIRRLSLIALAALAACSEPVATETRPAPVGPPQVSLGFAEGVRIAWEGGEAVTPDEAIQLVGLNGPQGALAELEADRPGSRWTTVLAGIASAEPAWLNVAAAMEPGVSGERAEELDLALKAALATDPSATLRVLEPSRQRLTQAVVCSGEARTTALLKPALETVTDPVLETKKTACLEAMG